MKFMDDSERKKAGLIITDCSESHRLGDIDGDFSDLDTFIIDHHKTSLESVSYSSHVPLVGMI